jgi:putative membrane-bound dehydrogenase-like protein
LCCLAIVTALSLPASAPGVVLPDEVKFAGLAPEEAARAMLLQPGFKATLFAGEPDVKQPIAFAIDHRGRLWVAEAYTYPVRAREGQGKDRILVFEDTDGDGKFDKRTVFMEGLNLVSGLEVGFGGVWVGAAPYFMFIPIQDGDEPKPAGPPQILLDGWGYQDTHETLNTFTWGPDGWLYGCHGVFTHSNVGKPGTPKEQRVNVTAAVWRYHPTRHVFERFAEGTSNPWGVDFDENGQCFIEACVVPHLWHMIQGARYERQGGQHVNPYVFDDIKTIGDHLHFLGNQWNATDVQNSRSLGGGHAHAGLMIYQGPSWPEEYRGQIFMNNILGSCINEDSPERQGSGFVGHHRPNFINFNDAWSQILNLEYDQDGSVYMIDWYDKNQCHHTDPNGHDRSNGRIFKIVYGNTPRTPVDLEKLSSTELAKLAVGKNEWFVRHARRALEERGPDPKVHVALAGVLKGTADQSSKLRALWALHATGGLTEEIAREQLHSPGEYLRAWAVQLLADSGQVSAACLKEFVRLAEHDPSPVVRLYVASAMQRVPVDQRWDTVRALAARAEDAQDHNLPLMVWYAAEPLATNGLGRALALAADARLPRLLEFMTRRAAAIGTAGACAAITTSLRKARNDPQRLEILTGLALALKGRRTVPMPEGWTQVESALSTDSLPEVRAQMQSLSAKFGSANALAALRSTVMDASAGAGARMVALDSLLEVRDPGLPPLLQKLVADSDLQGAALRALADYDDPATAPAILKTYGAFPPEARRDALNTLASRASFAVPLLAAVGQGTVPAKDLTADLIQQLRGLKNSEVDQSIQKVWGLARSSDAQKLADLNKYKQIFMYRHGSTGSDPSRGRAIFAKTCGQCHTLFGTGGKVGPDLTGSNRGDLDYILKNILDPSAVVPNEYRSWNVETKDDRSITGIVTRQDDKSVTVVTANETLTLPRDEIKSMQQSQLSMMPEGLLQAMSDQEVCDLLHYLSSPVQVPLPAVAGSP